uniref:Uncharacterized protein n=1 Tax=Heterorhabditis bacteriophora TaxID=37862 RepID=A0A1I7XBF9_HETBA
MSDVNCGDNQKLIPVEGIEEDDENVNNDSGSLHNEATRRRSSRSRSRSRSRTLESGETSFATIPRRNPRRH